MKGQIGIEYIVVLVLFITTVTYTFITVASFLPKYLEEVRNERLRSQVYQITQLLLNDPGNPTNWQTLADPSTGTQRIGLLYEGSASYPTRENMVSVSKLLAFQSLCSNAGGYQNVKSLLATDFDFSITINYTSLGANLINCAPTSAPSGTLNVTLTRIFSVSQQGAIVGFGKLDISMW